MIHEIADIAGYIFVALGLFFMLTGSVGILRFRDFFTRLHPAGITDSLGAPLALLGLVIVHGFTLASLKLGIIILLIYLTSPTACHALAKAAYHEKNPKKARKTAKK